jgi:hypothetical protein
MRSKPAVAALQTVNMRMLVAVGSAALCLIGLVRLEANDTQLAIDVAARQQSAAKVIEAHCVECHGGLRTRSGFDITTREGALKGGQGGPAIVPGESARSRLYELVTHSAEPGMPYKRDKLADDEIAVLQAWIDDGAGYARQLRNENVKEDWWSLRPLIKPAVPRIESPADSTWSHSPVDQFILARLVEKRLTPSRQADKRTLLRRVMFDLVGLPPTPQETAAFLADEAADAYERLVDRLLASPQYGERWARHWMDIVHYADTHGHDQDRPRPNAWPYRDYLIESFNADKPYGRFVEEQLAGDVLYPNEVAGIVAVGFLATGPWDESSQMGIREDSIDRQIARYIDRDDMLTTVMSTLVSTTVHCARCHDHKFDPISQEEYYRLQAVFAGVDKAERAYDPEPQVSLRRRDLVAKKGALPALAASADPTLFTETVQSQAAEWERKLKESTTLWQIVDPETFASTGGATLTKLPNGSIIASGSRPEKDTYTITFSAPARSLTGLKLEVLSDDSLPKDGPGRQDNGNLHLSELLVSSTRKGAPDIAPESVKLTNPHADFNQDGWTIAMAVDGKPETAWGVYPEVGKSHVAAFEFAEPLVESPLGRTLCVKLEQDHGGGHLIGKLRLSVTNAPTPLPAETETLPREIAEIVRTPVAERTAPARAKLAAHVLLEKIEQELAALPPPQKVYVATNDFKPDGTFRPAATPREVRLLKRGDINQPGAVSEPGALDCVHGLQSRFSLVDVKQEGSRRAALAHWVADPKNVLTWRSIVNRVWQYHFGRGLVDTPSDFGQMGALPTHPELLDWLTVAFQEHGGSLKFLHKLLVISAVYRQASGSRPDFTEIDGDNRFLWRMNRTRLDAESIRDAILRVSEKLDPSMGGPAVKQFIESPGIHVTPVVDYLNFDVDRRENYRRSVYRFIFRTLPDPFMETLDCADASQLTPVRSTSVTALQALAMLNDRFVVRQSEHIAARLEKLSPEVSSRIRAAYEIILGRPATPREIELVSEYAIKHGLPNAVRMLLNSNEFMFVN